MGQGVGDGRCLSLFVRLLFPTFDQPCDDIKAVVIQLVWLSPGTFDLLRSVILVGNTELCVFAVRADQQELFPTLELPLFNRGGSSSHQRETGMVGVREWGQGTFRASRSGVPKDLACVVTTER